MIAILYRNITVIISHWQRGGASSAHIGSERAIAICSTIGTGKLNSVNPKAGLRHYWITSRIIPSTELTSSVAVLRRAVGLR
jgi:hypothetical protein